MKRIGIFAGSFDPVHEGHLAFAHKGLAHGLDKVYFLVEPRPRRKQGVHALEHRLEMAKLAAASHKKLGVIHLEQVTFSPLATLPVLQARFKDSELVLLFGDDVVSHMVDHLADWPHVSELAKHTSLLIATRHHKKDDLTDRLNAVMDYGVHFRYDFVEPDDLVSHHTCNNESEQRESTSDDSSTPSLVPMGTTKEVSKPSVMLSHHSSGRCPKCGETLTISSSDIRLALKRGNSPTGLTPAVLDYIKRQKIYASSA